MLLVRYFRVINNLRRETFLLNSKIILDISAQALVSYLRHVDTYLPRTVKVSPDTMINVLLELWNSNVAKSDIESSVNATHA